MFAPLEPKEPKCKRRVRVSHHQPLPILNRGVTNKALWQVYTGRYCGSFVAVDAPDEIAALYNMGFFGKGSLSRSGPEFGKEIKGTPELVRQGQWERRCTWAQLAEQQEKDMMKEFNERQSLPVKKHKSGENSELDKQAVSNSSQPPVDKVDNDDAKSSNEDDKIGMEIQSGSSLCEVPSDEGNEDKNCESVKSLNENTEKESEKQSENSSSQLPADEDNKDKNCKSAKSLIGSNNKDLRRITRSSSSHPLSGEASKAEKPVSTENSDDQVQDKETKNQSEMTATQVLPDVLANVVENSKLPESPTKGKRKRKSKGTESSERVCTRRSYQLRSEQGNKDKKSESSSQESTNSQSTSAAKDKEMDEDICIKDVEEGGKSEDDLIAMNPAENESTRSKTTSSGKKEVDDVKSLDESDVTVQTEDTARYSSEEQNHPDITTKEKEETEMGVINQDNNKDGRNTEDDIITLDCIEENENKESKRTDSHNNKDKSDDGIIVEDNVESNRKSKRTDSHNNKDKNDDGIIVEDNVESNRKSNVSNKRKRNEQSEPCCSKTLSVPTRKKKVLVIPDYDEDVEEYLSNLTPRLEDDPFPIHESLHLTLEEAFFLCYGLGCLQVIDLFGNCLAIESTWQLFCQSQTDFIQKYVTYHYLRSKGWVVKQGIKFGGDFLLYKQGPPFYHASYLVIVEVLDEKTLKRASGIQTWTQLLRLNRTAESAGREVFLCQVLRPSELSQEALETPAVLSKFQVHEVVTRRWISSKEREEIE